MKKEEGDSGVRGRTIKSWVNEKEWEKIQADAGKAGMNVSGYVRLVLKGASVAEVPDADVPVLINEVRKVGMKLDELLEQSEEQQMISTEGLREILEENRRVEKMISEAYGTRWH